MRDLSAWTNRSRRGVKWLLTLVLPIAIWSFVAPDVVAQEVDRSLRGGFGMSVATFEVDQTDLVFTDTNVHRIPAVGWRLSLVQDMRGPFSLMFDGEFLLSNITREYQGYEFPQGTVSGFQLFAGSAVNVGRVAVYGAVGLSRMKVSESRLGGGGVEGADVLWVGTGGMSNLWAKHMNSISNGRPETVAPSIPEWKATSPSMLFGTSLWLFGAETLAFRLSADYTPVLRGKLRHNVRLTFSATGPAR